jgi:hypothetical protein
MPRYASLEKDLVVMLKEFFEVQFFSWLTIWAVKWNLLFMFKRVTDRLSPYTKGLVGDGREREWEGEHDLETLNDV